MKTLIFSSLTLLSFLVSCNEKKQEPQAAPAKPTPQKITQAPPATEPAATPAPALIPWEMEGMGYKYFDYAVPLSAIAEGKEGLKPLAGKGSVVFFFSATCPHCKLAYPKLDSATAPFREKGLPVYTIASGSNTQGTINTFVEETKHKLPLLQDDKRVFSKLYGVGTVPLTLWIASDGRYIKFPAFEKGLPSLMAEIEKSYP